MSFKMKTHIGINEEEVLVTCYDQDDDFYVDQVMYKGINIAGCLSPNVLDGLVLDWMACAEQDKKEKQAEANEGWVDYCF
jgi:hypothetical protein